MAIKNLVTSDVVTNLVLKGKQTQNVCVAADDNIAYWDRY